MKKRKSSTQTYDLPMSLLILGEQEQDQNSTDVLHALRKNTVSVETKNLVKQWEKILVEHTQNWSENQWKRISVEKVWGDITARIEPVESVQIYKYDYEGKITQYILQDDQLIQMSEWMGEEWARAWHDQNTMNYQTPHKRDVLPVMLTALLNVAALQMHNQANAIPFVCVCENIIKEYNKSSEILVQHHIGSLFDALSQQNAHTLLKEFHDKVSIKIMRRQWIKMGLKHAQAAWINKSLSKVKDGKSGAEILWEEIKDAAHTTPKHTQVMGDALFGKVSKQKVDDYQDYQEKVLFQNALKNILAVPLQEDQIQTWWKNPSDQFAQIVFAVVISEKQWFSFAKMLLNECSAHSRFDVIQKATTSPSFRDFLKVVPETYIRESIGEHLSKGQLQLVNTLMETTDIQLTEDNWNTYWNWMEIETPALGKGLRTIMEKKIMSAAIAPHEQTTSFNQKRKI